MNLLILLLRPSVALTILGTGVILTMPRAHTAEFASIVAGAFGYLCAVALWPPKEDDSAEKYVRPLLAIPAGYGLYWLYSVSGQFSNYIVGEQSYVLTLLLFLGYVAWYYMNQHKKRKHRPKHTGAPN